MWDQIAKFALDNAPALINAGASLAGGYMSGQGGQASAKAQQDAANQTSALQRQIYMDQRGLAAPGYMTGGAASNKLAALFGIAPQNYQAAYGGGFSGGGMSGGSQMLPNLGAGQPVQGRSGGGGPNAAAGAIGSIAGTFFGGPIGSAVGGALGGMIRDGGDNWKTVATQAPGGFDYAAYMQQPDLQAEWAKPDIKALFGGNQDAYANWHYNQFGKNEGRTLAPMADTKGTMPTGGAQQMQGGASNPLAEFYASPYAKLATTINDQQFDQIKGNLGAAGKSISGAAEGRYAKTLAGNTYGAFGDYTNQLANLAGMNQTSSQLASNAAGNYGVNAGNAMMKAGDARANALSSAYQGYSQAASGVAGAAADYFRKPGKPTYGQPGYVDPSRAAYPGQGWG
jgi:hypothetical protein